jgi:hypothetical protein
MNKKFIGATAVTVILVGGVIYYRHVLLEKLEHLRQTLDDLAEALGEEEEDPDAAA